MVLVSVPDGDVSLLSNVQNRAGEVCLDEVDHGFLLLVEAQQGLHLACTAGRKGQYLSLCPRSRAQQSRNPGFTLTYSWSFTFIANMIIFGQKLSDYVLLGIMGNGGGIIGVVRRISMDLFSQTSCKGRRWLCPVGHESGCPTTSSEAGLKRWGTHYFVFESKLGGVGVSLHLLQLLLHSGFLRRASSQLRSQLALVFHELDVVVAQLVEAQLQLLKKKKKNTSH